MLGFWGAWDFFFFSLKPGILFSSFYLALEKKKLKHIPGKGSWTTKLLRRPKPLLCWLVWTSWLVQCEEVLSSGPSEIAIMNTSVRFMRQWYPIQQDSAHSVLRGDSLLQQKPYDRQSQNYVPLAPFRSLPAPLRPLTSISSTAHREAALNFESPGPQNKPGLEISSGVLPAKNTNLLKSGVGARCRDKG